MQCEDNKSVVPNNVLLPVHRFNKGVIIDAKPRSQGLKLGAGSILINILHDKPKLLNQRPFHFALPEFHSHTFKPACLR